MKGRSKRASGGVNEMAQDATMKTERRNIAPKIFAEAEARKSGGKTVKMSGDKAKMNAGRKPRKSGGRTGSNMNPLSSAASGTPGKGRNVSGSLD